MQRSEVNRSEPIPMVFQVWFSLLDPVVATAGPDPPATNSREMRELYRVKTDGGRPRLTNRIGIRSRIRGDRA